MTLGWMAWTWQTGLFFGAILFVLIVLTLLAIYRPEKPKLGILGFPTTRGDRFFASLLGTAFIFILYMRFGGELLWYPFAAAVVFAVAMFRLA